MHGSTWIWGAYPLFRMVTVYAALRTWGLSSGGAMIAQAAAALVWAGVVLWAWRRGSSPRQLFGVAVMASMFVSPYGYDYDVLIVGVALALLMPDLIRKAKPWQMALIVVGCWLSTFSGLMGEHDETALAIVVNDLALSLGAWPLMAVCLTATQAVYRGDV